MQTGSYPETLSSCLSVMAEIRHGTNGGRLGHKQGRVEEISSSNALLPTTTATIRNEPMKTDLIKIWVLAGGLGGARVE